MTSTVVSILQVIETTHCDFPKVMLQNFEDNYFIVIKDILLLNRFLCVSYIPSMQASYVGLSIEKY